MARRKRTYKNPVVWGLIATLPGCGGAVSPEDDCADPTCDPNYGGNPPLLETGGWTQNPPPVTGGVGAGGIVGAGGVGAGGIVGTGGVGTGGVGTGGVGAGGVGSGGVGSGGITGEGGISTNPPMPETGGFGGAEPETFECEWSNDNFWYPPCVEAEVGESCYLPATQCTSGLERRIVFTCVQEGSEAEPTWATTESCDLPYEGCTIPTHGRVDCIEDQWRYMGFGGNPPAPCPETPPEIESDCRAGNSFGADPAACGYPCSLGAPSPDSWTIIGCEVVDTETNAAAWMSDGACTEPLR